MRRGFTLGSYPAMSLAEARSRALDLQRDAESGVDPVAVQEIEATRLKRESLAARTVGQVLDMYLVMHVDQELKPGQSRLERRRQLAACFAEFREFRMDDLTRGHLQAIVDAKRAEGKVVMANRLRAAMSAFTRWVHLRGYAAQDVGAAIQKGGKEKPRERTPSLAEVQEIWEGSLEMGDLWGPYFRLCILTGQRCRSDVLNMKWSWVNMEARRYEIPDPMNRSPHIVPLSDLALRELQALKANITFPQSPFVITTNGQTPSSGVSNAKLRLEGIIVTRRTTFGRDDPMDSWVLHDLRRSQATALAEAGFDEGVVDRIQNHVAGGSRPSAVAGVYNKARKLPERTRALEAWAAMVLGQRSDEKLANGI